MPDETDPTAPRSPASARRARREPATIDLTAEAVSTGPATPDSPAPATEASQEPSPAPAGTGPVTEDSPGAAAAPDAEAAPGGTVPPEAETAPGASTEPPTSAHVAIRTAAFAAAIVGAGAGAVAAAFVALFLTQGATDAVESRVTTLEQAVPAAARAADLQALDRRLTQQADGQRRLEQALQARPAGAADPALAERLARLEQSSAAPAAQAAEASQATRALAERVTRAEAALARAAGGEAAARLVLAARTRDALDAGRPLAPEIAALAALGTPDAALAPLKAIAGGAPTRAALAADLARIARERVPAEAAPAPGADLVDRLWSSAAGLVRVTRQDETGAGLEAASRRIAALLEARDIGGAVAAWEAMPAAARSASAAWGDKLKALAAADSALATISNDAVAALGAPAR